MADLDQTQQRAVFKSLIAKDYHLILGTPGSGKTRTVTQLVKVLALQKKKVLIVSLNNQVVDGMLKRLKASGFSKFIRIASSASSVDPEI